MQTDNPAILDFKSKSQTMKMKNLNMLLKGCKGVYGLTATIHDELITTLREADPDIDYTLFDMKNLTSTGEHKFNSLVQYASKDKYKLFK